MIGKQPPGIIFITMKIFYWRHIDDLPEYPRNVMKNWQTASGSGRARYARIRKGYTEKGSTFDRFYRWNSHRNKEIYPCIYMCGIWADDGVFSLYHHTVSTVVSARGGASYQYAFSYNRKYLIYTDQGSCDYCGSCHNCLYDKIWLGWLIREGRAHDGPEL